MLVSIFKRKSVVGKYTKPVDDDVPAGENAMLHRIGLQPEELPVIHTVYDGFIESVITTRRILWTSDIKREVNLDEVVGVSPEIGRKTPLSRLDYLKLMLKDGETAVLHVEPGGPLTGAWNLIANRVRRNLRGLATSSEDMSTRSTKAEAQALHAIIGRRLSAVTFVLDYWQFQFDGPLLNALTRVDVSVEGDATRDGEDQFRNRLCDQIGKTVTEVELIPEAIHIIFTDHSSISISLREQDYRGPEAAIFYGNDLNTWCVFRGD